MEKKLIVLSMEVKLQKNGNFLLNEVQIRALLAGLCAVYSEAALWLTKKNLAVMVVGESGELLVQALLHFENQFSKMKVSNGPEALKLLEGIAEGKEWKSCKPMDKLIQLNECQRLAAESESLGPVLQQVIEQIMLRLKKTPVISGYKNSWKHAGVKAIKSQYKNMKVVALRDSLYRFAVN